MRQAGAAVTVRTYWAWKTNGIRCVCSAAREALGAHGGRGGAGAYRVAHAHSLLILLLLLLLLLLLNTAHAATPVPEGFCVRNLDQI